MAGLGKTLLFLFKTSTFPIEQRLRLASFVSFCLPVLVQRGQKSTGATELGLVIEWMMQLAKHGSYLYSLAKTRSSSTTYSRHATVCRRARRGCTSQQEDNLAICLVFDLIIYNSKYCIRHLQCETIESFCFRRLQ